MALPTTRNQLPPDRRAGQDDEGDYLAAATPLTPADSGEFVSVDPDPDEIQIEPADDGGVFAEIPGETEISISIDVEDVFYSNLAEVLSQRTQDSITADLIEKIEDDKESRKLRDKQYEEGIRRTGLGNDAPGGAEFEGASRVVHPMITEACTDYESRIIKELWPPSGPVKPKIIGAITTDKVLQADRITSHMNLQLTSQMKEARSVVETTLTQVPLGGSQFIHLFYDARLRRPKMEFRSVDKLYVPFAAADFMSAERQTYTDTITEMEFRQRIRQKMYVDADAKVPGTEPDESRAQKASNKVEGKEDSGMSVDNPREIYETMAYIEFTDEMADDLGDCVCGDEEVGGFYPYLISIDVTTRKMLSMYRDWEENDATFEPIQHNFEFPFIPWRGALSIGLPQLIGGLSAAATGALRALLDSAHANNAFGGLIMKGSGVGGQTIRPQIGEFAEIEGGVEAKSIKDVVLPFSPTQPSGVLFQLLGFVVDAAKGVVRTSMDEGPNNTPVPVGTQMSRVEEGLVVFSAIHGRAHAAFNRLLAGLHRLNRLYLPEEVKIDAEGKELIVRRSDYDGPCVVQGVSDPTIYSDQQRFAQLNYIQQRVVVAPQLWKLREVELAGLKLMKWPDPESLLQDQPEPQELNPVNESLSMSLGQPVMVFPDQDHMAHLQVHLDYTKSPMFGMNPIIAPKYLPMALSHIAEHIAYLYVEKTVDVVRKATNQDPAKLMSKDPKVKREFDALLASATQVVVPEVEQMLAQVPQVLQQAQQMMSTLAPKPPMDPSAAAVQVATMDNQRKTQEGQSDAQLEAQKQQHNDQQEQARIALESENIQQRREGQELQAKVKLITNEQDAETARDIASMRATTGSPGHFSTGASLSDGKI